MASKRIVNATEYKVQDKDTLESIAKKNKIDPKDLAKFNFGTDNPDELEKLYRNIVGCLKKSDDGKKYVFTKDDDPGIFYIPKDFPDKTYDAVPSTSSTSNSIVVKPVVKKKFTPADCIVKFRPKVKWAGEYGFDWMRVGDYDIYCKGENILGDVKFEDIVGHLWINKAVEEEVEEKVRKTGFWYTIIGWFGIKKYKTVKKKVIRQVPIIQPDGNKYAGTFKKDDALFVKVENEYGKKEINWPNGGAKTHKNYHTSYLSIYLDDDKFKVPREIEIQACIKVKKVPERIYLKYEKEFFKIDPDILPNATEDKAIKISCLKELEKDHNIEVRAIFRDEKSISYDVVVGKTIVVKNSKKNRKSLDILVVKVITPDQSNLGSKKTGDPGSNFKFVKMYLNQAFINPSSDEVTLDFTKKDIKEEFKNNFVNGDKLIDDSKVLREGGRKVDLTNYCVKILQKKDSKFNTKYGKHLKIFYFGDKCSNLNGYSLGKNIALFPGATQATASHEIGHALGLPHTFTGKKTNCKFTYDYKKTENIMDYTHHLSGNKGKYGRVCFYHWQWSIMQSSSLAKSI